MSSSSGIVLNQIELPPIKQLEDLDENGDVTSLVKAFEHYPPRVTGVEASKYESLVKDVESLRDVFTDLQGYVEVQQEPLDLIEDSISNTTVNVSKAETELEQGSYHQTSYITAATILCIFTGAAIGAGFGGLGVVSIKPITTAIIGGCTGLAYQICSYRLF
jgi:hypothetical protein